MDHKALWLEPDADMRRHAQMRHEDQSAITGHDKATWATLNLAPVLPLRVPVKGFQHPPLTLLGRDRDGRQVATEKLALDVAGEVPAVAGLPIPRAPYKTGKELRALDPRVRACDISHKFTHQLAERPPRDRRNHRKR
jgi:hypothetical protein